MFQTTATPVTVYRSTDEGAPQLANAAGSLKTLLKACLTTGYGGKRPLGWECRFESADSAAFRSTDETSNRHDLQVKNTHPRYAEVSGFTEMSALDKGAGKFTYEGNSQRFPYLPNGKRDNPDWWLIGHGKAFVLLLGAYEGNNRDNRCGWLYFGDVPSVVPQDTGNTVLMHNTSAHDYLLPQSPVWQGFSSGNNHALFAKTWAQEARQAEAALVSAAANNYSNAPYPDTVSGGTMAAETYLYERVGGTGCLRALLPGVYKLQNNLGDIADGNPVPLDGVADTLLKFNPGGNSNTHVLINASHWEA